MTAPLADADQKINRVLGGVGADACVKLQLVFAQLKHIAEDRNLSALCIHEDIEGGHHGHGACVVAVVHDEHAVVLDHMETAVQSLDFLNAALDLFERKTKLQAHCGACKGVHDHMAARKWHMD